MASFLLNEGLEVIIINNHQKINYFACWVVLEKDYSFSYSPKYAFGFFRSWTNTVVRNLPLQAGLLTIVHGIWERTDFFK